MKVLISFCNQQPENYRKNLLLFDFKSGKSKYLLENKGSFTGLAQDEKYFYAISQGRNNINFFIIEKKDSSIFLEQKLDNLIDPHSLIVDGDFLYIISTGNDQVQKYKLDRKEKKIEYINSIWKPEKSIGEKDTHHVNSIFKDNENIYISAFGLREGERWSSAKNGYVLDITNGKKVINDIFHPHSLFISKGDYYYCESALQKVKKNDKSLIDLEHGYVRGLSIEGRNIVVGVSGGRKISKSTGKKNVAEAGLMSADCKVLFYKRKFFTNKYKLVDSIDFFPKHLEIYDVLIIN